MGKDLRCVTFVCRRAVLLPERRAGLPGLRDIRDKYFRMHGVYAGGTDYYCVDDHLNDLQFPAPAAAQHSREPPCAFRSLSLFASAPLTVATALCTVWPLSYRPEGNDATVRLDDDVDWTRYTLPDRPTARSEDERRRREGQRAEQDAEGREAAPRAPRWDDEAAPLLAAPVDEARSSGFSFSFSGLLRHRPTQAV